MLKFDKSGMAGENEWINVSFILSNQPADILNKLHELSWQVWMEKKHINEL